MSPEGRDHWLFGRHIPYAPIPIPIPVPIPLSKSD